uniref:Uncharacterized protein n=1 Tax=Anguilla anguilla TaxID=7936 RepID=A0A0E9S401_ANGAN
MCGELLAERQSYCV